MARTKLTKLPSGEFRYGDIRTRTSGGVKTWHVHTTIQNGASKLRIRQSTGCTLEDRQQAAEEAERIIERAKAGKEIKRGTGGDITFREWVGIYHERWERFGRNGKPMAEATKLNHRTADKKLLKFFGDRRLAEITMGHCLDYFTSRQTQAPAKKKAGQPLVSLNSVIQECQYAASLFRWAVHEERIASNPWKKAFPKGLPKITSRTRTISMEEQSKLLQVCKAMDPEMLRYFIICSGTSFRIGAMLNLPREATMAKLLIHGKRVLVPYVDVMSKGKMHRQPLLPEVHRAFREQATFIQTTREGSDKLFPYAYTTIRERLHKLRTVAKVAHFTPHDLRRTFGKRLGTLTGIAPKLLATCLNDVDVQMVQDTYVPVEQQNEDDMALKYQTLVGASSLLLPGHIEE